MLRSFFDFTTFIFLTLSLLISSVLMTLFSFDDAQARTPRLNGKTYIGTSGIIQGPNDQYPTIRVDFDEQKYADTDKQVKEWTAIHGGQELNVPIEFAIGIWDGYITDLFLGHKYQFGNPNINQSSLIAGAHNDLGPFTVNRFLNVDELPTSVKRGIVRACNNNANAGNGYRLLYQHEVVMRVWTRPRRRKKAVKNFCEGGSIACNRFAGFGQTVIHTRAGKVPINIQCDPPPQDISELKKQPKIFNAGLDIKTFGNRCPKNGNATVKIFGEGKRKVRYRILRRNSQYNSPWYEGRLKKTKILGQDGFALVKEHKIRPKLGPGEKKFKLEIQGWGKTKWQTIQVSCPPFKVEKVVLSIKGSGEGVICPRNTETEIRARANGPGIVTFQLRAVGGIKGAKYRRKAKRDGDRYIAYYRAKNKAYIDINKTYEAFGNTVLSNRAKLKISCIKPSLGKLTLRQKAGPKCEAEALIAIHTNVGGSLPYELECGSGRSWQGTVVAPGTNRIGVDKVNFSVKNNEQVTCILRTRLAGKIIPLGGASKTFRCAALSTPPLSFPRKPFRCYNGKTRRGRCICPRSRKKIKIGRNAFRCVPKKTKVICKNGFLRGSSCICPKRTKKIRLAPNRFRCVNKRSRFERRKLKRRKFKRRNRGRRNRRAL